LLLCALVVRAPGFFPVVITPDESFYLLQAQRWIAGDLPYVAVWDNHPVGVPALFVAVQLIAGESIYLVRALASLFVFATALVLYRWGTDLAGRPAGLASGILYISYTLVNGGLAANTEVFFIFWISLGYYLCMMSTELPLSKYTFMIVYIAAAGLSFGIAMQLNYVAVFEALFALLTATALIFWERRGSINGLALSSFVFFSTCAAPTIIAGIYFMTEGAFSSFFEANFWSNLDYLAIGPSIHEVWFIVIVGLIYAPLIFVSSHNFISMNSDKRLMSNAAYIWLLSWLCAAVAGILILRKFYDHHFLTLTPPLALLTALAGVQGATAIFRDSFRRVGFWALILLLSAPPVLVTFQPEALTGIREPGAPAEIANYLRQRMRPSSYLYVANYQPILYYLIPARIPTRFAFPSDVWQMPPGETIKEVDAIFAKQPEFVVVARASRLNAPPESEVSPVLDRYLTKLYTLDRVFADHDCRRNMLVEIWRLNGASMPALHAS
jgi:hypothetical protein